MTKQLYLIEYENAHWCGGSLNVVVWAIDEDNARDVAEQHMQQEQYELFMDQYDDVDGEFDGDQDAADEASACAFVVNSVEEFDENHDQWEFFKDETQESFYPVIGTPD